MLTIGGMRGTVPLVAVSILPFDKAPLWAIVCFFGAINVKKEVFEEGLGWIGGRSRV